MAMLTHQARCPVWVDTISEQRTDNNATKFSVNQSPINGDVIIKAFDHQSTISAIQPHLLSSLLLLVSAE